MIRYYRSHSRVAAVSALAGEGAAILTEARAAGFTGPVLGGNGFNAPTVIETAGPAAEDLQKVREMQRRERETALRQNGYWLNALVARYREGRDPRDILEVDRMIDALDAAAIRDAARRFLRRDNYVLVTLLPEKTP